MAPTKQRGFIAGVDSKGIKVSGQILNTMCSFELELSYINTTGCVIETSFNLPLDDSMTVIGMEAKKNLKESNHRKGATQNLPAVMKKKK